MTFFASAAAFLALYSAGRGSLAGDGDGEKRGETGGEPVVPRGGEGGGDETPTGRLPFALAVLAVDLKVTDLDWPVWILLASLSETFALVMACLLPPPEPPG